MRPLAVLLTVVTLGAFPSGEGAPRLQRPRVEPLLEARWGEHERGLVTSFGRDGHATNDLKTLLRHPGVVEGVMPFANYVSTASTLAARDRELLILRTAWLCRAEYLWAQHVPVARQDGLSAVEIHRVAQGPDAPGWDRFDAGLLRTADELHGNDFITDATWSTLVMRYNRQNLMDAMFAVAEYMMMATITNSLGVQPDAGLTERIPADVPYQVPTPKMPSTHPDLAVPRVPPVAPAEMTPEVRAMLDPTNSGRPPSNLFGTYGQHPKLYEPHQIHSEYIRLHSSLTARSREMLILRMSWLSHGDIPWSTHASGARRSKLLSDEELRGIGRGPGDPGWDSFDATLLRAADELRTDDMISDATWNTLAKHYTVPQLIDVMVSAVGYRIVAMFVNTFGVQMDRGTEHFPWQ